MWLLLGGTVAAVLAAALPVLRPAVLAFSLQSVVLFTGGYVPYMHVINLMPWAALFVCAVASHATRRWIRSEPLRRLTGMILLAALLAVVARPWFSSDRRMMTVRDQTPLAQADAWVGAHVPRDSVVVVHDALWTDLVHKYGFEPKNVIMVYKLDSDPAVNAELRRIDYLVLPDYYFVSETGKTQYPTAIAAQERGIAVARFGDGLERGVTVYRVSPTWSPRG